MKKQQTQTFLRIFAVLSMFLLLVVGLPARAQVTISDQSYYVDMTGFLHTAPAATDLATNAQPGTIWHGFWWDGGDMPGAGSGPTIHQKYDYVSNPNILTIVQESGGQAGNLPTCANWYRVVPGDFTCVVDVSAPYINTSFRNFGIMARIAPPDGSGRQYRLDGTGTNFNADNYVVYTRGYTRGQPEVLRFQINGVGSGDISTNEPTDIDNVTWTNMNLWLMMRRDHGTNFTMWVTTNLSVGSGDPSSQAVWQNQYSLTVTSWAGQAMEVGLSHGGNNAIFSTTLSDWQSLVVTNDITGAGPAAASAVTISKVNSNTLHVAWTTNDGSAGHLVVARANKYAFDPYGFDTVLHPLVMTVPVNNFPAPGNQYTAVNNRTNWNINTNCMWGGGGFVVFNQLPGTLAGTGVDVTSLQNSNNIYTFEVYSYKQPGGTNIYNQSPAVGWSIGPAYLTGISFSLNPTNVPVGGAALATLIATYEDGASINQAGAQTAVWSSSNTNIATVAAGVVGGVATGTATISVTFAGSTPSQVVNVVAPAYTNDFHVTHDFVTNGLPGTDWEGLYLNSGDVAGSSGGAITTWADQNILNPSNSPSLTISNNNGGWNGAQDNGFFLFKNGVIGDFQTSVHVSTMDRVNNQQSGLMGRWANADPQGRTIGSPPPAGEMGWHYVEYNGFSIPTIIDRIRNGARQQNSVATGANTDYWLLMIRSQETNFYMFRKINASDPWTADPAGGFPRVNTGVGASGPMQVGLMVQDFGATPVRISYDHFMLDAGNVGYNVHGTPPGAAPVITAASATPTNTLRLALTPAGDGTVIVLRQGGGLIQSQPQDGVSYTNNFAFNNASPLNLAGTRAFDAGSATLVIVTNISPGFQYTIAAYSYSVASGSNIYNKASVAITNVSLGSAQGITLVLPGYKLPLNGLGFPTVTANYGGGTFVDVTANSVFSSDNPAVIVTAGTNGLLTGVSLGTANIKAVFTSGLNSYTNIHPVTVYQPSFHDEFGSSWNYLSSGASGNPAGWDGAYIYNGTPGSLPPGSSTVPFAGGNTTVADANMSAAGLLTVTNVNVGWEGNEQDAFFLFKYVPQDFQTSVHLNNLLAISNDPGTVVAYNNPGLLVRGYSFTTNNVKGAPFQYAQTEMAGATNFVNGERTISLTRFDQFGYGTYTRYQTPSGNTAQMNNPGQIGTAAGNSNYWMLIRRTAGTNFTFYERTLQTDPYVVSPGFHVINVTNFVGTPLQVGIMAAGYDSGNSVGAQFDHFMVDSTPPLVQSVQAGNNVNLSWNSGPTNLQYSFLLGPSASWHPVVPNLVASLDTTTTFGVTQIQVPITLTNKSVFFRLQP